MRHDTSRTCYFTKSEAQAMVGKVVQTNAGRKVTIVSCFSEGKDKASVLDAQGHSYAKSTHNGAYCWLN